MRSRPVTLWHRKGQDGQFEFNHLDDGHAAGARPAPKHPNQVTAWSGGEWIAEHAWLDARNVVIKPDATKCNLD